MAKDLSLIIPCYNEELNIPLIFKRCSEILPKDVEMEIILVNNGSNDGTKKAIEENCKLYSQYDSFILCDVKENVGYGYGILKGLEQSTGKVLAWTHADMQTDPLDVIKAYQLYKKYNDPTVFIKGKRLNRAIGPNFFTWGMSVIASFKLGVTLTDIGAQPKLFSRIFYEKYLKKDAPVDFSLDLYAMYFAKKFGRIETIPVVFANRAFGEAKGGGSIKTRIKVTKRVLNFIFALSKKLKTS